MLIQTLIIGGGAVIQTLPLDKGGGGQSPQKFFSAIRASVWSKKKGEGRYPPGPFPGSTTVKLFLNKF